MAYTAAGGLRAVVYTDFLQTLLLIGGGVAILFWHLNLAVTAVSVIVLLTVSGFSEPPTESALGSVAERVPLSKMFEHRSFLVAVALYTLLTISLYLVF